MIHDFIMICIMLVLLKLSEHYSQNNFRIIKTKPFKLAKKCK